MAKQRWTQRTAKRELAEAALKLALEKIQAAGPSGGSTTAGGSVWYLRALEHVRIAERLLSQSEGDRS